MECCVGADNEGTGIQGEPLGVIMAPGWLCLKGAAKMEERRSRARAFIAWHNGHGEREERGWNKYNRKTL